MKNTVAFSLLFSSKCVLNFIMICYTFEYLNYDTSL